MKKTLLRLTRRRNIGGIHHYHKPGTPPGTLTAHSGAEPTRIHVMGFDKGQVHEQALDDLSELPALRKKWRHIWVNVDGLANVERLDALGQMFNIHPLALEDVVNTHQRAKVEQFEHNIFIVCRQVAIVDGTRHNAEQVSMFVGKGYVLTFQEHVGDCLDPVRDRIRKGQNKLHTFGTDYLAYAILDAMIDGYFPVLEMYSELLDTLEDNIMIDQDKLTLSDIHNIKRDLMLLRHAIWPLRDALNSLVRENDGKIFTSQTELYLRDCQDHVLRIVDILENYREQAASLKDLYLSVLSTRMNEVMKVLTIIATIFMPLGFIAGVYGMNFNPEISRWNMPETQWAWGYPFAIGLMILITIAFTIYFYRKGWLNKNTL